MIVPLQPTGALAKLRFALSRPFGRRPGRAQPLALSVALRRIAKTRRARRVQRRVNRLRTPGMVFAMFALVATGAGFAIGSFVAIAIRIAQRGGWL